MNEKFPNLSIQKIFKNVFGKECAFTIEEIKEKFAFDVKIPKQVRDTITGEITWADSISNNKFITLENMEKKDKITGWMIPKKEVHSLEEIIHIWNTINFTTTERIYDSNQVYRSDTIYQCENVYASTDCINSNHIIFCESVNNCEYVMASVRSNSTLFSIKVDDSKNCSNCYHVICSNKISNSLFIDDCFNLYECIFCSHIANKRFCIANMQFEEKEYYQIKEVIVNWILNS